MQNKQVYSKIGLYGTNDGVDLGYIDPTTIETIAREASNQPLEAQAMVAKVIRQRSLERGLLPKEVVLQPLQFSCWNKGTAQSQRTPDEMATAQKAWDMSVNIKDEPNLYHDTSVTPSWTKSKNVQFVKQIGKLKFYREKR